MARISIIFLFVVVTPLACWGANVTGVVTDASGKPLENARIDHTGKSVVVAPAGVPGQPSKDEVRTDAEGRFRVVTNVAAVVVRKPGYESQRILLSGDLEWKITLQRIGSPSRCKLPETPAFETKQANDVDYTATWFYIQTKNGAKGIISGRGPVYSWGAPDDQAVWTSTEYREVMYENGVIDASGRASDGTYWRRRSILGAAAQYYRQDRETAEQLDCVMERAPVAPMP